MCVCATLRHLTLWGPPVFRLSMVFFSQFNALFYAAYFMCCVAPAAFCSFHAHFVARTQAAAGADPCPLTPEPSAPPANGMFNQGVKKTRDTQQIEMQLHKVIFTKFEELCECGLHSRIFVFFFANSKNINKIYCTNEYLTGDPSKLFNSLQPNFTIFQLQGIWYDICMSPHSILIFITMHFQFKWNSFSSLGVPKPQLSISCREREREKQRWKTICIKIE